MTAVGPVIAGFSPDPSVCRVGATYYAACSSFEYFPGVPIWTSPDLLHWTLLAHALDRPSQLAVRAGLEGASRGIFAPTLRHHGGRFWMITTNVDRIADGHLLVHTEHPAHPWSEPVFLSGIVGIDPDLVWDEYGVCRVTWADFANGGISQAIIDPMTGRLLSDPIALWSGSGLASPEGPHAYHVGEWWYLLVSEGGTHTGHGISVARARAADGPYEPAPGNPLLSHRGSEHAVQATGHGDLVERADGSWAMLHLGIRQRGSFPRFHVNGRETFLTEIAWRNEWPVVSADRAAATTDRSFTDTFVGARHPRWISPGTNPAEFAKTGDGLVLAAGRLPDATCSQALLATRVTDDDWTVTIVSEGDVALVVRIDDAHWWLFAVGGVAGVAVG